MTSTTAKIVRITDLANPQHTEAQLARLREAGSHPVELTVETALAAARNATGLVS
jgi:hypothetical protein